MVAVVAAMAIGRGAKISFYDVVLPVSDLTIGARMFVGALTAVTLTIMFKCVYHLHRLLGDYSRGEIFTRDSAGQIRQWGICCVLWGGMGIVWAFVPRMVLAHSANTIHAEGGAMIVTGLIIVAISWFMEMAAEMREESELTV
jgi:xanthine/uracil permease